MELLVRALPNGPDGWHAVEAYDTPKGATRPCYHWYVVSPGGRVWCSPDGERRTVELRTAQAETALDVNALAASVDGREN